MQQRSPIFWGLMFGIIGISALALAVPKPDPTPSNPNSDSSSTSAPEQKTPKKSTPAEWKAAYERAGRPRFLIICGIEIPGAAHGIGANIDPFDATGDPVSLRSGIEYAMLKDTPEVRLVKISALEAADRRSAELLRRQDPGEAIRLMCTKLKADFAFIVRMIPDPKPGVRYVVQLELVEIGSARVVGSFAFDWKLNNDAATIRMYGSRIAGKLMDQFTSRPVDAGRSFVVRVFGLPGAAEFLTVREAIKAIPNVKQVTGDEFSVSGTQTLGTLNVDYNGGPVDLVYELQNLSRQKLGLAVDAVDAASGSLTLITHHKQRWQQLVEDETGPIRAGFEQAYRANASPEMAILIGRPPTEHERNQAAVADAMQQLSQQPSSFSGQTLASYAAADLDAPMGRLIAALKDYDALRQTPDADPNLLNQKLETVQRLTAELKTQIHSPDSSAPTTAPAGGEVLAMDTTSSGHARPQAKGLSTLMERAEDKLLDIPFHIIDKLSGHPDQAPAALAALQSTTQAGGGGGGGLSDKLQGLLDKIPMPFADNPAAANAIDPLAGPADGGQQGTGGQSSTTRPAQVIVLPAPPEPRRQFSNRIVTFSPPPEIATPVVTPGVRSGVDSDQLASAISKRLLAMKVRIAGTDQIRQTLSQMGTQTASMFREDQLAVGLRHSGQVQILILGVPQFSSEAELASGATGYSFKAIRTSDGAVLAAENWTSPVGVRTEDALSLAADYVAGNLADQLNSVWSRPNQLTLRIANAKSPNELMALVGSLRDALPGATFTLSDESANPLTRGPAICWVTYGSSRADLVAQLQAAANKLPFQFERDSGDSIDIRLREVAR
jgi:hypothetical protein